MMENTSHDSVLLKESVDALVLKPEGNYIDGTFGRGGHSRAILARLSEEGRLIAFDKDPQAIEVGQQLANEDSRFSIVHSSFAEMPKQLSRVADIQQVDGILLDLGVSSPQLDQAQRGFSFLQDGPLDMRMNNTSGQTAAQWLAIAEENDIAHVLKEYGEERFSRRMARAIVQARQEKAIERTLQLADIVSAANPKWEKGKHPATRAFQAIRIYINGELDDLSTALRDSIALLKAGGSLVVISFHSLEDRLVKRFFREKTRGKVFPINIPVTENMLGKELKTIGKAVKAGGSEVDNNVRSRSAVMRVAQRLGPHLSSRT